jgi:hypothetical protein
MGWIPRWSLVPAVTLALVACASTERSVTTGPRHGAEFLAEISPESVSIACKPPSGNATAGWVDECNELARRFLGQMVATGRLSTLPDPPFGQAAQAVKSAWRRVQEMDGVIDVGSMTISRDIELTPAEDADR